MPPRGMTMEDVTLKSSKLGYGQVKICIKLHGPLLAYIRCHGKKKTSNISRLNSKTGNQKNLMREDSNEVRQYKQQISDGSMALNIKWMPKQTVKTVSVSQAKESQLLSSNDKISSPRRCSYQSSNGLANSTKMASHGK